MESVVLNSHFAWEAPMTAVTSSEAENFIYTQRDTFVYIHNTDFLQFYSILLIHFLA